MKSCCIADCQNQAMSKNYCRTHYQQISRFGKILVYTAKEKTYQPLGKRDRPCCIKDCDDKAFCKGMCSRHYARDKRHGSPLICYSPPKKPKESALMRDEMRYQLSCDEHETLSELFKEGVGINEGETVMHYE